MTLPRRRVVLVGGGHAHVEVLRSAARRRFAGELLLVSPFTRHVYSSVMPAQLRGGAEGAEGWIDLAALCTAAGGRFVEAAAERLEGGARPVVRTADETIECDIMSIDVGSGVGGADTPGVHEHASLVRPLDRWRELLARVETLDTHPVDTIACCVVGGGAAGVELSLALARRFARVDEGRQGARLTLVEGSSSLLSEMHLSAGALARSILVDHGVDVLLGREVVRVHEGAVELNDATQVPSQLTVWVAGTAPAPLLARSDLVRDANGYLLVDATLRSADGAPVWGAGDCITLRDAPWMAKAGVYAVREAPVLARNLRAAAAGEPAIHRFVPQRTYLSILDTADGRALLHWRGLATHARWAHWLKRVIDHRYVERYVMTSRAGWPA